MKVQNRVSLASSALSLASVMVTVVAWMGWSVPAAAAPEGCVALNGGKAKPEAACSGNDGVLYGCYTPTTDGQCLLKYFVDCGTTFVRNSVPELTGACLMKPPVCSDSMQDSQDNMQAPPPGSAPDSQGQCLQLTRCPDSNRFVAPGQPCDQRAIGLDPMLGLAESRTIPVRAMIAAFRSQTGAAPFSLRAVEASPKGTHLMIPLAAPDMSLGPVFNVPMHVSDVSRATAPKSWSCAAVGCDVAEIARVAQ